jgi:hypothetical protein
MERPLRSSLDSSIDTLIWLLLAVHLSRAPTLRHRIEQSEDPLVVHPDQTAPNKVRQHNIPHIPHIHVVHPQWRIPRRRASYIYRRTPRTQACTLWACISRACMSWGIRFIGVHVMGVYLINVHLIGVHLTYGHVPYRRASSTWACILCVHLIGISLISMHPLIGVHFIGVHLTHRRASHS